MVQANFLREPQFSLRTQWERIFSLFSFRAFCSTWQGLSALPHTRVWQSSGWPCQQLQGCLALSDESVGNLVYNIAQDSIFCTILHRIQSCTILYTRFNLVQYCFVFILKFFRIYEQNRVLLIMLIEERVGISFSIVAQKILYLTIKNTFFHEGQYCEEQMRCDGLRLSICD